MEPGILPLPERQDPLAIGWFKADGLGQPFNLVSTSASYTATLFGDAYLRLDVTSSTAEDSDDHFVSVSGGGCPGCPNITAYPNPANDILILHQGDYNIEDLGTYNVMFYNSNSIQPDPVNLDNFLDPNQITFRVDKN